MRRAGQVRWEVGGEFDRRALPGGEYRAWPSPHRLYGLATHAVLAVWEALPAAPSRTLHVPEYFCPEVVDAWRRHGIRIREYTDDPRLTEPVWSSLDPADGDAVLAVDYFGVRSGGSWARWRRGRPGVLLIEDHSHDPGSRWARQSKADYAFASLRKTVPVSDGAILWSPRGASLPPPPNATIPSGSDTKWAAMALKHRYLAGAEVDKDSFRAMQIDGERSLVSSEPAAISPWSLRVVNRGLASAARRRRRRNVRRLIDLLADVTRFRPLFTAWPRGHCPFNAVLLFASEAARDACRGQLIGAGIYPPVHWDQPPGASARARDLASRILTIPADQRYDLRDMRKVAAALRASDPPQPAVPRYSSSRGAR